MDMKQLVGELMGTMILILLGDGVVAAVLLNKSKAQNSGWIVITAGWAFAVLAGVFTAAATGSPQADLNPAVTVAKMVMGGTTVNDGVARIIGELVGAFLGAVLVFLAYYRHWSETSEAGLKLAVHSTGPAVRDPLWNVVTEIIGTFVLVFVIFAIFSKGGAAGGSPSSGVGPYLVACLVWGIGLSLGGPTGYAINPARDLGPRIAHAILPIPGKGGSDWGYSWVPVVGPVIGGVLAALLAKALGM
ncbi:MAG: major intrinsic protein [Anaerolineales bacterium]|nr:major intrinsic protein [Anaerolineales bacterium]